MKGKFTKIMAALALLVFMMPSMVAWGQEVTLDFTTNIWDFPTTKTVEEHSYTNGNFTITLAGSSGNGYQWYSNGNYLLNGKSGAYLRLPAFSFDVERIEVVGRSGASGSVKQNIFVGETAVSTETTGATGTNSYIIADSYQSAGNIYTLKVTSAHNTQVTIIHIYKKEGTTPSACATPTFSPAAGTYTQAQNVSISCATEGATIYYTTNGNDPTTNSTVYVDPISVSSNMTIKAMAVKSGFDNSAVATAEYAFITLDHAGTLEDPYTVADAHTAIDANAGTQNVYATGIVSNIETAWSSQYNNITFNFIDEEGDEAFLQAFRCVSGTGVDASTVVVGDVVVVYGDLTKYGSTYEFGQGCQLVSLTHTAEPFITVNPTEVNVGAEGATGTLSVTCENIDDTYEIGVRFYADPQTPATDPAIYEDWFEIVPAGGSSNDFSYEVFSNEGDARTAYLTICAFATNGEMLTESQLVTFNQAAYVAPTFAELPFSFNGGKAAIEETDGLSQEGLGTDYAESTNPTTKLKFDGTGDWLQLQFNERPGTLTFDIKGNSFSGGTFKVQTSADGVSYSDLETYTTFGNNETFEEVFDNLGENVRYIKWIYTEKVSGNVGLGNITLAEYVAPQPSITVTPTEVNINAEGTTGTLTVTCENIDDTYEIGVRFYADPQTPATNPAIYEDWFEIVPAGSSSNDFSYEAFPNEGDARTAYLTICAFATNGEMLTESQLVTINQAAPVVPPTSGNWVLTDLADLTSGDVFVIVGVDNDTDASYAMSNDKGTSNAPTAVAVTIVDNTLSCEIADNIQWNLTVSNSGYTFYPAGSANTWLYCTNSNNGVRVGTNANNIFVMEEGYLKNVATSRYVGIYNSQDWRCYNGTDGNIAGQTFAFYKKVSDDVTYTKSVAAYEGDGGYVLIASPVCSVAPSADNGFLTSEYDLYAFDQAQEQEWRNYEASNFNLVSGKGYMYASSSATTLTFTGQPYNGNGMIPLDYTEGVAFAGWNLVGNPYAVAATPNKPYYRLNAAGSEVSASTESSAVDAMEGVFVVATEAGQTVSFSTANSGSKGESIALNVMKNRGTVIDRAIVRFDEGGQLPKFQLFENSTKLYIPQGNSDYAIVRSAAEGEMPVNFKAKENGTYTISVNSENVEMDYLHLIDNMTGTDVDLLATPSYTFNAKKSDYASRFKLVFSANGTDGPSTGSGSFAYYNGSEWQISNIGEATLQVVDVMGRIVKNVALEGNATVSINEMPGVYMMRLLNGNDVKVQKVVIR